MAAAIRVIIVNYNAGDMLTRCVQSVLSMKEHTDIKVVDNASSDGSDARIRTLFGHLENVEVLQNTENVGFSRAVNTVAGAAGKDDDCGFLLILNPDCEMHPGALKQLRKALESDRKAALAGPLVIDEKGGIQKSTFRSLPDPWKSFLSVSGLWHLGRWFPRFRGIDSRPEQLPRVNSPVEAVTGACMLVRAGLFREIGGFDEGYGLHCEDLDLMQRLRLAGYHCVFVPSARAYHRKGLCSRSRPFWVHRQKHSGMQRFFEKFQSDNYSRSAGWLVKVGIWLHWAITLPQVMVWAMVRR